MTNFKSLVSKYANASTQDVFQALKRRRTDQGDGESSSPTGSQSTPVVLDEDDVYDEQEGTVKKMMKHEELNGGEDIQLVSGSPVTRRTSPRSAATVGRAITADSIKTNPLRHRSTRSMTTTTTTTTAAASSSSAVAIEDDEAMDSVKAEESVTVKIERRQKRTVGSSKGGNFVNGYTPPEVYAHLDFVPDHIGYDLDVLFVGINPGVRTSEMGHHYSGPSNHFWPCLNECGLLPPGVKLRPQDDHTLPARFNLGLTNLVDRPSRSGAELSSTEARAAAPILMAKIKKYRPRFVCFVSKQAWDMFCGVGLGLQTGFVSWDDEDDRFDRMVQGEEGRPSFKNKAVVKAKEERGVSPYRLAPFFTEGPALDRLNGELEKEGVPVHFNVVKDEDDEKDIKRIKEEDADQDVKRVKKEEEEDEEEIKRVKKEESAGPSSSSSSSQAHRPRRPVFRGSRMFVTPSTSGRVTQYRKEDKLAFFRQLAELVHQDRLDRGLEPIGSIGRQH